MDGYFFAVSDRFLRVHSAVFGDSSTAHTWLPDTSLTTDSPIAPEPAHKSTTQGWIMPFFVSQSRPACTTVSVSGRGMNTPGPTFRSR